MNDFMIQDQINANAELDGRTLSEATQPMRLTMQAMRKVPEITALFWIIKLLTTGMGENDIRLFGPSARSDAGGCSGGIWFGCSAGITVLCTSICGMDLLVSRGHGCHIWYDGC